MKTKLFLPLNIMNGLHERGLSHEADTKIN